MTIWEVNLRADPKTKEYTITELDRPLLDLPPEDVRTLAWLEQTFKPGTPHHKAVQGLAEHLRFYLPIERRADIEQQRTVYVLELGQQDDDRIDPEVEIKLRHALSRRLRVEFDYLSPQNETGRPCRHEVDVFEPPRFEPSLGHYYVRGWCHTAVDASNQQVQVERYLAYRLGRISAVRLLPYKLPSAPRPAKRYRVEYRLTAAVARQGVTRRRWIGFDAVDPQPDGSHIVRGATDDLFFALQELMHYRHHCVVLGGPELLQMMRETVQKMAEVYEI